MPELSSEVTQTTDRRAEHENIIGYRKINPHKITGIYSSTAITKEFHARGAAGHDCNEKKKQRGGRINNFIPSITQITCASATWVEGV